MNDISLIFVKGIGCHDCECQKRVLEEVKQKLNIGIQEVDAHNYTENHIARTPTIIYCKSLFEVARHEGLIPVSKIERKIQELS